MTSDAERKKMERFVKIAEKRTERVLDSLRLLGQCSNRRSYGYTDDQVNRIFREIRRSVRQTEGKFREVNSRKSFRLR
jgi:hypothetical protein